MKKYDVAIIGAGPCGISCAIEMSKHNKEVLLLEQGKNFSERNCNVDEGKICVDCNKCNVISGFGGCVQYGESVKLSYYPSGKALYDKLGKCEYEKVLNRACSFWEIDKDNDFLRPNLSNPSGNFEVKNYPVCVMDKCHVQKIITKWYDLISRSPHVDFKVGEEMIGIMKEDIFQIEVKDGKKYKADRIVLGMGRGGMIWLRNNLCGLGIRTISPVSTIGLRFEMPKQFLQEIGKVHPDLKIRKVYNDKKYKTFCYCGGDNGGQIKFINYGKYVLLDGHVLTENDKDNLYGNFALLTQLSLPEGSTFSYSEYINSLVDEYIKMNAGKPICQNFIDFKNMKDVGETRYNEESSVKFIPYRNVHRLFGDDVRSFCYVAEEIFHYILADTNVRYEDFLKEVKVIALELEGLWDKVETNSGFETSSKGIYVGGDCAGETQGALQATMMGIKIADSIVNM